MASSCNRESRFCMSNSDPIRVALLGFGTVGAGTYRMLQDNKQAITAKIGRPLEVVRVGVKDPTKPRSLPPEMFTTDLGAIVDDPNVDVVLELIGGIDPAADLVERALNNGKHVVTANKELIAKHGSRLVHLAKDLGLDLHFEAAVGGGIPIVQPLKHQLAGNDVLRIVGILNGTTNYILTKMADEGADFADVLKEAQAEGYAEADPTNDVEGIDACYKISILASIAFGKQVDASQVYREGITGIAPEDMKHADTLGYRIKLLGIVEAVADDRVLVRVHPTLVPKSHPLASVSGVYNAVWIQGDFVGDVLLSGRGAGASPTASAVMGDLIDVGRNIVIGGSGSAIPYGTDMRTAPIEELETSYYLRMRVQDRPKALGSISTIFGNCGVSFAAMEMRPIDDRSGEIVFLSHPCRESDVRRALEALGHLHFVEKLHSCIRVEAAPEGR